MNSIPPDRKAEILSEIRRMATKLNGQPPGQRVFENETGIKRSAWRGKYWSIWTNALLEAGLIPNQAPERIEDERILEFLVSAIRQHGKFPSDSELRMYRQMVQSAPAIATIRKRFRTRVEMIEALLAIAASNSQYRDIQKLLPKVAGTPFIEKGETSSGWVYLLKSGHHCKIGRSDTLERRIKQISISLPEATVLLHAIQTDDSVGIEKYWHQRFEARRANGEWFALTQKDITAFKRRKFM